MRDTKSLLLLLVSLLLVLVSFVLIWTWGYNFYSKNIAGNTKATQTTADSASIANKVSDSLQRLYAASLKDLDVQLDSTLSSSDSLSNQLDSKLAEFYRLKEEIATILKNKNTNNGLVVAKQKISELQSKVDNLKEKNQVVDKENKKLYDVVNDMAKTEKANAIVKNNGSEKMNTSYSAFTASDMRLFAIANTDDKETETNAAERADKLTGAFTVMNFNSALTNAEMMVVVIKPDGKVLKGSGWDAGTFTTAEGRKIYSYKFNFTYTRGEAKRLAFSLKSGNLSKGNYTMEVYQNGLMIGKVVKTLS